MPEKIIARRRLLRFLLASPLLAAPGLLLPRAARSRPELAMPETLDEVLDVFQMKRAAQKVLDPETWHFIVNGADDQLTLEAAEACRRSPVARPQRAP